MQDEGKGTLPCLLTQDLRHVGIGVTGMNYQRQSGRTRCGNMDAKASGLLVAGRLVIEIIKTGFADCHDLGMICKPEQLVQRHILLVMCIVRMGANRAEHIVKAFGNCQYLREFPHPRRDRHHAFDTRIASACHDSIKLVGEIGKIQMAMAVDQHGV